MSQNIKTRPKFRESFKKKKSWLILVQIENLIYILNELVTKQLAEVCLKYFVKISGAARRDKWFLVPNETVNSRKILNHRF